MSRTIPGSLVLLALVAMLPLANAQTGPDAESDEKTLEQFRDDLQAAETQIITRTVPLTTEEATRFWPVFQRFQAEQKLVIDSQAKAVREFAESYDQLTPDEAVAFMNAQLQRDQQVHDLRVKYLAEFAKVIPANKAARVIQVSRRLGVLSQARLSASLPLVR